MLVEDLGKLQELNHIISTAEVTSGAAAASCWVERRW